MTEIPVQIVLRPYASALPLACFAFATGNALYASYLLGWVPQAEVHLVALLLLVFAAPLELAPSALAFVSRDTGGATAFGVFGASWVVEGVQLLVGGGHEPDPAGGIFLICLTVCLLVLTVVTFKGKPLLGVLLSVAILRTAGAAAVSLGAAGMAKPTACAGLVLTVLAFYAGAAFLEEDVTQRLSPLTFRTGEAKAAMEGHLEEQVEAIKKEAGVRKQL